MDYPNKEFITLRELERRFVESERVVRHVFKKLIRENKLIKDRDYCVENFKDERHFIYKIDSGRIAELAPELTPIRVEKKEPVNQADNHALTKPQNGQQVVNQTKTVDNEPANQNILLEQLRVKDGQIQEKDKQIKRLQEDNVELKQTHRFVLEQIFSRLPPPPENRENVRRIAYEQAEQEKTSVNDPEANPEPEYEYIPQEEP